MPPGKRTSPERRFEKNTEYERGRLGVRVHFVCGPREFSACRNGGLQDASRQFLKFPAKSGLLFRAQIGSFNHIMRRLEEKGGGFRAAETDRLSEMEACFLQNLDGIH